MTFTFLPCCIFCVSILTNESLSGRDCSWNKPRACPTKKIKTTSYSSYGTDQYQRAYQLRVDRGTAGIDSTPTANERELHES